MKKGSKMPNVSFIPREDGKIGGTDAAGNVGGFFQLVQGLKTQQLQGQLLDQEIQNRAQLQPLTMANARLDNEIKLNQSNTEKLLGPSRVSLTQSNADMAKNSLNAQPGLLNDEANQRVLAQQLAKQHIETLSAQGELSKEQLAQMKNMGPILEQKSLADIQQTIAQTKQYSEENALKREQLAQSQQDRGFNQRLAVAKNWGQMDVAGRVMQKQANPNDSLIQGLDVNWNEGDVLTYAEKHAIQIMDKADRGEQVDPQELSLAQKTAGEILRAKLGTNKVVPQYDALGSRTGEKIVDTAPELGSMLGKVAKGKSSTTKPSTSKPYSAKDAVAKTSTETTPVVAAPTKKISTDEEYNALPNGTVFMGPDNVTRKKP